MRCVHPQPLHTGSGPGSVQPAAAFTPLWLSWGAEEWHLPLDCLSGIIHQFNSLLLQPGDKAMPCDALIQKAKGFCFHKGSTSPRHPDMSYHSLDALGGGINPIPHSPLKKNPTKTEKKPEQPEEKKAISDGSLLIWVNTHG